MEYNINEIVEWLKGKASECGDNYSLQRKYFDAVIYLHRLDVVLKRIALEKVDVATMETEATNTDSDNQKEVVEETTDNITENVDPENNTDEAEA